MFSVLYFSLKVKLLWEIIVIFSFYQLNLSFGVSLQRMKVNDYSKSKCLSLLIVMLAVQ